MIFNNLVVGGAGGLLGFLCSRMKLVIEIAKIAELKRHLWARYAPPSPPSLIPPG
jgi:hypothetical protein